MRLFWGNDTIPRRIDKDYPLHDYFANEPLLNPYYAPFLFFVPGPVGLRNGSLLPKNYSVPLYDDFAHFEVNANIEWDDKAS